MKKILLMLSLLVFTSLSYADCKFSKWNASEYWCNGAVGYDPKTKRHASAVDYYTTDGARSRVKKDCPTCSKTYVFWNGCGVMAYSRSLDVYGFAARSSTDGAKSAALSSCQTAYTRQYQANARAAKGKGNQAAPTDNRRRRESVEDPVPETTDCQVVAGACTTTYSVTYY